MLQSLTIKNLALIDALKLDFGPGFNVLTGETGAGKSVITGAVGLLTGGRADKSMIRHGAERCELNAVFRMTAQSAPELFDILEDAGIEIEGDADGFDLHLRRVMTPTGTRNFVNDTAVTAQFLARVGAEIIDIHAANEHFSLHQPQIQLALLDRFCHNEPELEACRKAANALRDVCRRKTELLATIPKREEADTLRDTITEIEEAALRPNEDQDVASQYSLAANAQEVLELVTASANILDDSEGAVTDRLREVHRYLERLHALDPEADSLRELCENIAEQIGELSRDLERYSRRVDVDEESLHRLDDRLAQIQRLKRRYGPTLDDIFATCERAREQLDTFENAGDLLAELEAAEVNASAALTEACAVLHQKRQAGTKQLISKAEAMLGRLGFLKASFSVSFSETEPGTNGADRIEFLFSANPGEPLGPLRLFASSGEMSRVMLALKAVLSEADAMPVLLFDEIDVNIGGETAAVVGEELRKLAHGRQILCISHLAQVAVQAENHIRVVKHVEGDRTLTAAEILEHKGRVEEIARMLGGGAAAVRHAEELLHTPHSS